MNFIPTGPRSKATSEASYSGKDSMTSGHAEYLIQWRMEVTREAKKFGQHCKKR
jgi:hypothetical protein